MFSTLDGLEFEWELKTVEGVGSVNAKSVLRYDWIYSIFYFVILDYFDMIICSSVHLIEVLHMVKFRIKDEA